VGSEMCIRDSMRVDVHQSHLKEMQERSRLINEQNLKRLQLNVQQTKEHNAKLIQDAKPQHTVDVRA
jgi:hypothetical protein